MGLGQAPVQAPGQTKVQLVQGKARNRVSPATGYGAGRSEDESTVAEFRVRDLQVIGGEGTAAPQHNIKIEHPRAPSAAHTPATEFVLDMQEAAEQSLRFKF